MARSTQQTKPSAAGPSSKPSSGSTKAPKVAPRHPVEEMDVEVESINHSDDDEIEEVPPPKARPNAQSGRNVASGQRQPGKPPAKATLTARKTVPAEPIVARNSHILTDSEAGGSAVPSERRGLPAMAARNSSTQAIDRLKRKLEDVSVYMKCVRLWPYPRLC
jgi:hypothetical protein